MSKISLGLPGADLPIELFSPSQVPNIFRTIATKSIPHWLLLSKHEGLGQTWLATNICLQDKLQTSVLPLNRALI